MLAGKKPREVEATYFGVRDPLTGWDLAMITPSSQNLYVVSCERRCDLVQASLSP
jgi:hypothetical protein